MSTPFYDLASLVVVPSGYKSGKIYAQKPLTTDGQLTFTRSNDTATRVASNGLIERVRTNLALYSEDYTNAYWTKGNVTLTANSIANPVDGATTAETITPTAANASHYLQSTPLAMSASTEVSQSIYAKANGYNYVMLEGYDGANNPKIMFNVSDGSFSTISASGSPVGSVEALANGWYRLKMTWQTQAGSPNVYQYYFSYDNASANSFAGNGTSGVYLFGAQLEYGVTTDYIATTSAAVSVGPVANVPRLDFLGSSCPRLNLEPQRTNSMVNSETFASWTGFDNITIGSNTSDTLDPAGYNGSDKITIGSGAPLRVYQFTGSTAGTGTISLFAKAGTASTISLFTSSASLSVSFNLATQVVTPTTGTGTITSYGNGWYRITATATLGSNEVLQILFTGSNGQTIYVWGAQVEAGAYATSYIPTLGSASTRGSDAASKTGISSLIGQTEGTLFVEAEYPREPSGATARKLISVNDGSSNNLVDIYVTSGLNTLTARLRAGATGFGSTGTSSVPLGNVKIAYAYKANDYALYINGTLIQAVTTGGAFTFSSPVASYQIGDGEDVGDELGGGIKQALLFKTRLSNADLAALTA
jgi:hypothetical protein